MANTAINHDPAATFPGSSTDTAVVKWSGTGGKTLVNSGVLVDASNNITGLNNVTATGYLHLTGDEKELRFYEGANYIAIKTNASLAADYTFTLPLNDGNADEFLQTNGSGVLTWAAAAGTTINSNADNRVITGSGTANTLNGEANLTFDGTHLSVPAQSKIFFDGGSNTYIQELTANNLAFYADGAKQLTIGAGLIMNSDISAQNITFQNGTGNITFPASVTLSSNANTLDDYEEGTFTPVFQDWSYSNSEGQTYTNQVGRYVKIGRWVTIQIYIASNLDSSTLADGSQAKIDGLPFAASTGTGFNYAICCSYSYGATLSNTGSASQNITGMVNANTAYVILHKWSTYQGVQPLNYSHIDDRAFSMVFTGQYETDA